MHVMLKLGAIAGALALPTSAIAQTAEGDPYGPWTQQQCQDVARYCINTYASQGYATPNECWDAHVQDKCPDGGTAPPSDGGPGTITLPLPYTCRSVGSGPISGC